MPRRSRSEAQPPALDPTRDVDELRSNFLASVTHELRTPLALISGYSQSLLELDLDEATRRRFYKRISGATSRMLGMVDQLLDAAMLENDQLAADLRRMSLNYLLKSIVEDVAEMPGSLPVTLSVPPDMPPVYADRKRIGQVLANLLDNARKYGTPDSTVLIRVQQADDRAVVSVDNDGPEILPEERERVFERFYRGRDAKSSGMPGVGLGLHLCRRLVEAHGGRIWLEERRGGTRVSFSLPLALDPTAERGHRRKTAASSVGRRAPEPASSRRAGR